MKRITSLLLALVLILSISTSLASETYTLTVEQFMVTWDLTITDLYGEPYKTEVIEDSEMFPIGMIYYAFNISDKPGQGLIVLMYDGIGKYWLAPEYELMGSILAIKQIYDRTDITDGFVIIQDAAKL